MTNTKAFVLGQRMALEDKRTRLFCGYAASGVRGSMEHRRRNAPNFVNHTRHDVTDSALGINQHSILRALLHQNDPWLSDLPLAFISRFTCMFLAQGRFLQDQLLISLLVYE